MVLLLLSRKDSIHLPRRPDLALFQLIAPFAPADRRGRLIGRYPGIDPLRSCPERARDDGLDRDRLALRIRMQGHTASHTAGPSRTHFSACAERYSAL